jgi:hypothetical protein
MRFLRILALVALCLAYAPTPAMAVTGYDSAYSGESAFVTISPGQTLQFQVFFSNTGTLTWTKGGDTQVDLAACLADKVTCNAQDTSESSWNSGWLSTTRYTTTTQATVAPGALATFAYNIKAPSDATAGVRRFNGDLVVASSGARIHPEGYYQDAEVQAAGSVPAPSPTPTPTATPGSTPFPSAPPVIATPTPTPIPNPLLCFDGTTDTANGDTGGKVYGGVCTRTSDGAVLDNSVPVGAGDYSGVYYARSSLAGKPLSDITQLSFNYTGTPTAAGSPRISLPIDSDGNGTTNFYAFISAFHCDEAGLVDPIHGTCTIFYTGGPVSGESWEAFAAHEGWKVGTTPFVVADEAGTWTVSNVHLGE